MRTTLNTMAESTYLSALTLWNYHHLNHSLNKSDAILVLCSHDLRVAQRAAELFLNGWAHLLIFSGGLGVITKHMWSEPEADLFARIALEMGVPAQQILIENRSSNTGENVLFTKQLLEERQLELERFIVVQKPYMERRSFATFKKVWPQKEVIVTSPQDSFDEYLSQYTNPALTPDDVISIMVGDLQRIQLYPQKGFQIPQFIPADVWAAYEALIQAGYDRHLASS
ncbi:YdcF family protein [Spirosoma harenae]